MEKKFRVARKDDDYRTFSIRVSKLLIQKVDEIARTKNRSRNEVINMCVEFAVENLADEIKVAEDTMRRPGNPKDYR